MFKLIVHNKYLCIYEQRAIRPTMHNPNHCLTYYYARGDWSVKGSAVPHCQSSAEVAP